MVNIVIQLKLHELIEIQESIEKINVCVQKTKWGNIILN